MDLVLEIARAQLITEPGWRAIMILWSSVSSKSLNSCCLALQKLSTVPSYRVNIFGFPKLDGLPDMNPGLLDQRLGLEWVRDNIGGLIFNLLFLTTVDN